MNGDKAAAVDYSKNIFEDGGSVVVDMTTVAEAKFENVAKGIYDFEVESVEFKTSAAGNPMLETWNVITTAGDYQGRKMAKYYAFSAKALPFTKADLAKVYPELLATPFKPEDVANSGGMLGKTFRARVTMQNSPEFGERSQIGQILPKTGTSPGNAAAAGKFA